jgi:hypothetical protein
VILVRRVLALVALAGLAGCGAEEGASTRTPDAPVSVVSSIPDGEDLVGPVQWEATITLHGVVQVRRVEFLVDERVRWTQKAEPWRFSADDIFSPWVLGPGEHELVVRVVTNPGPPVEAVSHVTVPPAPTGSAALAGTYTRDVTSGDAGAASEYRTEALGAIGSPPPLGRWTLELTARGEATFTDPFGAPSPETYTAAGRRLRVYGPATWLGESGRPFGFCRPEKAGDYSIEVRGAQLVVLAEDRVCADRDQVLVGTWTRTT